MILTLKEARDSLQSTHSADDADLTLRIKAAESACLTYLKLEDELLMPEKVLPVFKVAVLILLDELYNERSGTDENMVPAQYGFGYLPRPVIALLFPHRRLTL